MTARNLRRIEPNTSETDAAQLSSKAFMPEASSLLLRNNRCSAGLSWPLSPQSARKLTHTPYNPRT